MDYCFRAKKSVFSKKNIILMKEQEKAMGVLPHLQMRLAPMVGQNALVFLKTNSVIILKSNLIFRFKYRICRQPGFL